MLINFSFDLMFSCSGAGLSYPTRKLEDRSTLNNRVTQQAIHPVAQVSQIVYVTPTNYTSRYLNILPYMVILGTRAQSNLSHSMISQPLLLMIYW